MTPLIQSAHQVPFDGSFKVSEAATSPPEDAPGKKALKQGLEENIEALRELQDVLYAHDQYAVLLVFQAMDAAGKDGTIRAVTSGINPAGFQVYSFKRPSAEELDHDFLWRTSRSLPERGRIGVFNRSYYEEVLVARVHPKILDFQKLPPTARGEGIWEGRYASLRDHEHHLWRNGTIVLKFWLNVSRQEQLKRFLKRLEDPERNWKFESGDVKESRHWGSYMQAYEEALNATSRPWAPWYAIPADDKTYMRWAVSDILRRTMEALEMGYPAVDEADLAEMAALRDEVRRDLGMA